MAESVSYLLRKRGVPIEQLKKGIMFFHVEFVISFSLKNTPNSMKLCVCE